MDLKNIVEDRYLLPPKEDTGKVKEINGSFYNTILKKIEEHVEKSGDWIWLNHIVTGDAITAKEAITYGKKFATFFGKVGLTKGDTVHVLLANHKLNWSVAFGAWILGGIVSMGSVSLDPKFVAEQMFLKDSFNLETLVDAVVKLRPKEMAVGAHYFIQLAESSLLDSVRPEDLDSLCQILPTGSAVPESCLVKLKKKFKNLKNMVNIYGSTELGVFTIGFSTSNLGQVNPGCKVKIVDLQTGHCCLPNTMGEICAMNPARMSHYLNRPKETEEIFDEEGFGRNGDLGMYTEDGDIVCIERLKEIIKYCSFHVAPTEIEDVLQQHPAVLESLVYGRPEPSVMELVCAVVVLKKGHKATEAELIAFANDKVSEYKWIRGGIIFRDNIPRNSMGKLVRKDMRDWAIKQHKNSENI